MLGKSFFRLYEDPREFANAWIMPNDQQGFHRAGRLRKNLYQRFGVCRE